MAGFTIKPVEQLLQERGLQRGGTVQKYIDNECKGKMAKFTPKRSGILIKSANWRTIIGTGEIHQVAPYSRVNYYYNAGRGTQGIAYGGTRGPRWFERMKAFFGKLILAGAAQRCGAKPKGG